MARPAGLEPATLGLEGRCSIQMSYGRIIQAGILSQAFLNVPDTHANEYISIWSG